MSSIVKTLSLATVWLLLPAIVFYFLDAALNPNTVKKLGAGVEVVLQRDPGGHYRAEAIINGVVTPVLVDTGATAVSISPQLAAKLGLHSHVAIRTQTANGETVAYATRLASIRLGGIEAQDVAAIITPRLEGDALLGMSFLSRMDVRLYKGAMTIRPVTD
jgi:aspartyl protease family protein